MKPLRILLADDHAILRSGLRLLIEREPDCAVVAEAANGREAVQLAERHAPDMVVIDVAMPLLNGIEASRQILAALPKTAIAILSMHSDETYILRALRAGVRAYILKESAASELLTAIRLLASGRTFFSPKVARLLEEDYIRRLRDEELTDSYELLTTREREVLQLIAEGKVNKEIAELLRLSLYTVETHRSHILDKLNLHSTADLILYAVRKSLVR